MKKGTLDQAIAQVKNATTIGAVMDGVLMCDRPHEVEAVMAEYRKTSPHADSNIRHMLGYCSDEVQRCYRKLLDGETPAKTDWMTREQLVAALASTEDTGATA